MPNWCSNSMAVYGSPDELKDFRQKLLNAVEKGDKLNNWHLYQIYEEFGYSKEEILNSDKNGYIRGTIYGIGTIHNKQNYSYFYVEYDSAWSPMIEGFDYLLHKHYKTLNEETLAEECGNCVYVNTDKNGTFFAERYCVYLEDYDTYYLKTEKEVIDTINKYCDNKQFHSLKECETFLDENDGYLNPQDNSCYCTINEFEPY